MERSFFLKKRRADFVAGGLSGRVIVAGGLGKNRSSPLSRAVVLVLDTALEQQGTDFLHTSHCFTPKNSIHSGLDLSTGVPMCSFSSMLGKWRARKKRGHIDNCEPLC